MLITGQPPLAGRNAPEVWNKIRQSEPPHPRTLNARVNPDLEAIRLRALAKNRSARYPSAAALEEDLQSYLAGEAVTARPVGWWQRRVRWLRKHPGRAALALTAAIAVFDLLAVIVVQSIALRDQKEKTEAVRGEAERYRQSLEVAEEKTKRLQADQEEEECQPADMP